MLCLLFSAILSNQQHRNSLATGTQQVSCVGSALARALDFKRQKFKTTQNGKKQSKKSFIFNLLDFHPDFKKRI